MNIVQIKHALRRLSLGQMRKLDEWLHELIRKGEEAGRREVTSSHRQVIVEKSEGDKTYRLESVRCGKVTCRCAAGKMHGPHWYSYTRVAGRLKSLYVGKKLPHDVENELLRARRR